MDIYICMIYMMYNIYQSKRRLFIKSKKYSSYLDARRQNTKSIK